MENSFKTLALNSKLHQNLDSLGFSSMTPIQAEALPFILEGHDLIAKAKTGSGKTATFGLGILNKIEIEKKKLQALVICPTRELAVQVAEELRRLARNIPNCKILVITGGASEYQQLNSLDHGAHIIVGTPGRLLKFLNKGAIELETISFLVLDEADRMLDMGFQEDMEKIISYSPKKKQTLLFSATFPLEIEELSANILVDPKKVEVDSKHEKNFIKQIFVEVSDHKQKSEALVRLLGEYKPASTVVFCKTKQICGDVAKFLGREGISALPIHGDLEQNERTVVLTKFSNHSCLVLVATDVAARGLDIKDLEAVINFDLPNDADTYTHRIGRTARAGKVGLAFSLFVPYEKEKCQEIENYLETENEYKSINDFSTDVHFDLTAPMKTLYINGGKKEKIRPGDILGALVNVAGLTANQVGNITILDRQTYVAVDSSVARQTISKLAGEKIKGLKFKVGEA